MQRRLNEKNEIIEQEQQGSQPAMQAEPQTKTTPKKPPKQPKAKKNKTVSQPEQTTPPAPAGESVSAPAPIPAPTTPPVQPERIAQPTQPVPQVSEEQQPQAQPKPKKGWGKKKAASQAPQAAQQPTPQPMPEQNPEFSPLEFEDIRNLKVKSPIKPILYKIGTVFLVICCVYMAFLIYGVQVTNYVYDSSGLVVAERMTIDDIRKNKEFNKVYSYYIRAREIYEKALVLDYQLSNNADDAIMIATEYEELLNPISTLSVQLEGYDVSSKYIQFKKMLLVWVQTDMAVYLQDMSAAISQNNADKANQAIEYKEKTYNDFYIITQNLIALSEDVKNVDITGVREWSPSNYIEQHITGLNNN